MVVKRIGALSLGKVMAAVYGGMGLIFGAILALLSLLGGGIGGAAGSGDAFFGLLFGVGAVIALPLMYGDPGVPRRAPHRRHLQPGGGDRGRSRAAGRVG